MNGKRPRPSVLPSFLATRSLARAKLLLRQRCVKCSTKNNALQSPQRTTHKRQATSLPVTTASLLPLSCVRYSTKRNRASKGDDEKAPSAFSQKGFRRTNELEVVDDV